MLHVMKTILYVPKCVCVYIKCYIYAYIAIALFQYLLKNNFCMESIYTRLLIFFSVSTRRKFKFKTYPPPLDVYYLYIQIQILFDI